MGVRCDRETAYFRVFVDDINTIAHVDYKRNNAVIRAVAAFFR